MKTKSTNSINFIGRLVRLFDIMLAIALIIPVTVFSQ